MGITLAFLSLLNFYSIYVLIQTYSLALASFK